MSRAGMLYVERDSSIHRLDGSIKFLLMILWIAAVFLFNDLRVFIGFFLGGLFLLKAAKIKFSEIRPLFIFILIFTLANSIFLILITPEHGSELAGSSTVLLDIFGRRVTGETLWFALTLSMKYLAVFPIMILFIFTTHPTRFASSLARIGVSYKVAYAINIALRYIPDVRDEFVIIMKAQEARGVPFHKGDANLITRFNNYKNILVPLVISSLNRIDVVSNAMTLRGFGIEKTRTWYGARKYEVGDFVTLALMIVGFTSALVLRNFYLKGFWYPF